GVADRRALEAARVCRTEHVEAASGHQGREAGPIEIPDVARRMHHVPASAFQPRLEAAEIRHRDVEKPARLQHAMQLLHVLDRRIEMLENLLRDGGIEARLRERTLAEIAEHRVQPALAAILDLARIDLEADRLPAIPYGRRELRAPAAAEIEQRALPAERGELPTDVIRILVGPPGLRPRLPPVARVELGVHVGAKPRAHEHV